MSDDQSSLENINSSQPTEENVYSPQPTASVAEEGPVPLDIDTPRIVSENRIRGDIVKPREYNGDTSWRSYQAYHERAAMGIMLLVFSKCFPAGFGAFSTLKFKVIEGTKTKTYLVFISMVVIHSVCHC